MLSMSLLELVDNSRTDKNTTHSYLALYQYLLAKQKYTAKNVLEVGVWRTAGSIKLWYDFFPNADIYGLDRIDINDIDYDDVKNIDRIKLYTSISAYDDVFFKTHFLDKNIKFDLMIDDGPHTLDTMIKFIQLYSNLISDNGIIIIEDVQSWDWIKPLTDSVPEHLKPFVKTYDLRFIKERYDDIVFTIDRSNV